MWSEVGKHLLLVKEPFAPTHLLFSVSKILWIATKLLPYQLSTTVLLKLSADCLLDKLYIMLSCLDVNSIFIWTDNSSVWSVSLHTSPVT